MNTECSHCGHSFETGENLAACPKCEQVFEPSRTVKTQIQPKRSDAASWTGNALLLVGIAAAVFYNFFLGAVVAVAGIGLAKFARK